MQPLNSNPPDCPSFDYYQRIQKKLEAEKKQGEADAEECLSPVKVVPIDEFLNNETTLLQLHNFIPQQDFSQLEKRMHWKKKHDFTLRQERSKKSAPDTSNDSTKSPRPSLFKAVLGGLVDQFSAIALNATVQDGAKNEEINFEVVSTHLWKEAFRDFKAKAKCLDDVMQYYELKKYFVDFLKNAQAFEYYEFLDRVEIYRMLPEKLRLDAAQAICKEFIYENAPSQINLQGDIFTLETLKAIIEQLKNSQKEGTAPILSLFDATQGYVKNYMASFFFKTGNLFVDSPEFKKMVNKYLCDKFKAYY